MSSERVWPTDGIGNPIKKGDLVRMDLPEKALLFRIVDVTPAQLAPGPQDSKIPINGDVEFIAQIKLQYTPGQNFPKVLVLREPEQSLIAKPDGSN